MRGKIKEKIADVPDFICEDCSQLWCGECRAFEMYHSRAEFNKRQFGILNCQKIFARRR